jgi:peptidoglycan/xylan/chitin deacetylase (PgdA/CDA1 family)
MRRLIRSPRPNQARMITGYLVLLLFAATNASLLLLIRFDALRALLVVALYSGGTIATLFLLFHPRNQWLVANRHRLQCTSSRPCVGLTFDDGPSEETTPRVLDILRDKDVRATFFVVGRQAERYPDLVRRMVEDGHAIGNHTYTHPPMFCFLTPSRLRWEVAHTQVTLSKLIGRQPSLFRSPVGLRHPFLAQTLEDAGVEYISWELRTLDTRRQDPDTLRAHILSRIAPGDIVLMHDRPARGTKALLAILPDLIDRLRERGYEFGTP